MGILEGFQIPLVPALEVNTQLKIVCPLQATLTTQKLSSVVIILRNIRLQEGKQSQTFTVMLKDTVFQIIFNCIFKLC